MVIWADKDNNCHHKVVANSNGVEFQMAGVDV